MKENQFSKFDKKPNITKGINPSKNVEISSTQKLDPKTTEKNPQANELNIPKEKNPQSNHESNNPKNPQIHDSKIPKENPQDEVSIQVKKPVIKPHDLSSVKKPIEPEPVEDPADILKKPQKRKREEEKKDLDNSDINMTTKTSQYQSIEERDDKVRKIYSDLVKISSPEVATHALYINGGSANIARLYIESQGKIPEQHWTLEEDNNLHKLTNFEYYSLIKRKTRQNVTERWNFLYLEESNKTL